MLMGCRNKDIFMTVMYKMRLSSPKSQAHGQARVILRSVDDYKVYCLSGPRFSPSVQWVMMG